MKRGLAFRRGTRQSASGDFTNPLQNIWAWTAGLAAATLWPRIRERMRNIEVALKESNRSLLTMLGLVWLMGSWVPPGAASDRPDTKFRKGVDPRNPPPGYYESESPPLRRQVLGGLTSALGKIARLWRK